jgi:hypothetical protein
LALQLLFIAAAPVGMLLRSRDYGGLSFFLTERLNQYLYLEGTALILLFFTSLRHMKTRELYTGKPVRNLGSPFPIINTALVALLVILEFNRLGSSRPGTVAFNLQYLVIPSIPLYAAAVLLGTHRNPAGYITSLVLSLGHLVLTPVLIRDNVLTGIEGTLIIIAAVAACFFSVKGIMEYHFHNHKQIPKIGYAVMRTMLRLKRIFGNTARILELAGIGEGMKILDYGCGTGNYSIAAAKKTGAQGRVLCADRSEKMLSILRKRAEAEGLSQVISLPVQEPKDIPEGGFHFIFLIDVLHMIDDKVSVVRSLYEKRAEGGKLLIKFEHFTREDIEAFLKAVGCRGRTQLHKNFWLLD